jgi:hypothetical protein
MAVAVTGDVLRMISTENLFLSLRIGEFGHVRHSEINSVR